MCVYLGCLAIWDKGTLSQALVSFGLVCGYVRSFLWMAV